MYGHLTIFNDIFKILECHEKMKPVPNFLKQTTTVTKPESLKTLSDLQISDRKQLIC